MLRENSIAKWWRMLAAARWEVSRRWHRCLSVVGAKVTAAEAFRSASQAPRRIQSSFRMLPEWREEWRKAEWEQLLAAARRSAAQQAVPRVAQRELWAACWARRNNRGHFLSSRQPAPKR